MPIDLSIIGKEGRVLFRTWKKEQTRYDSAKIRKEFKERDGNLDKYNAEIRSMNEKYRKAIKKEEKNKRSNERIGKNEKRRRTFVKNC